MTDLDPPTGDLRDQVRKNNRRVGRRASSGYALLIVLIVILTTTAIAAVHQRHLTAALRVEQARIASEAYARGPLGVLAIAIDRLKTGDPPAPIEYRYEHHAAATTTLYRISYAVAGTRWTVTAEPDPNAVSLSVLPSQF